MPIAREGAPVILAFIGLHFIFMLSSRLAVIGQLAIPVYWSFTVLWVIFAVLALFSLYFFRDPERKTPEGTKLVVSPADGRVLCVDEVIEEKFIGGPTRRLSIFMNIFDVHVNRFPVSGKIAFIEYRPGKFFNASLDKASVHNEALSLGLETEGSSSRVMVRQIAGLIARRIVCRTREGDTASCGERFGMIRFGSRVEVYLPLEVHFLVTAGERVTAGETILAELP
ncbi:MAG TPA: phosphatidylserine decarboxylase family protein [archaeon]|nr:phosphatidylserine decarboxylase family protein [archaeon]